MRAAGPPPGKACVGRVRAIAHQEAERAGRTTRTPQLNAVFSGDQSQMQPDKDRDLAALLLTSVKVGALPLSSVVAFVDSEISQRPAAPSWMLDASLASNRGTLVAVLDRVSFGHPVFVDPATRIEVLSRALEAGSVTTWDFSTIVSGFTWADLSSPLIEALIDLDEEANCACSHGGIPQGHRVAAAAHAVSQVSPGISYLAEQIGFLRAHGQKSTDPQ